MDLDLIRAVGAAVPRPEAVLGILLLALRLGALFLFTPLLNATGLPLTVRVLFTLGVAAVLAPQTPAVAAMEVGSLLATAIGELALGSVMALSVLAAFGAISVAGRLIDVQIGFGMAQVYDPATQRHVPVVSAIFERVGVLVFFLLNAHHALLRGVAYSIDRFPVGATWTPQSALGSVLKQAGALFALGFSLAAPVVVGLLLLELMLGVVARNLPQMNMFVVGIPVKILAGTAALGLFAGGLGDALAPVYAAIFRAWDESLAGGGR